LFNIYEKIKADPKHFKQFRAKEALVTQYDCPLDTNLAELWSQHNYVIFVVEGIKIWHTPQGAFTLKKGDCVLVRKGASIVEQFFDAVFCLMVFFIPEDFIYAVLQSKQKLMARQLSTYTSVIPIEPSPFVSSFFHSMNAYFSADLVPDPALLEIKFRELVLTIADNPRNEMLLSYFSSILHDAPELSLQRVMEENFCFNLKLEAYARLCNRSLSAFKRDFLQIYGIPPGKHAKYLLVNLNKNATDAAFESGFENVSHFSRAFKDYFGQSPMQLKTANFN
jgi:AraC family transcriptional regulator, exoenzyme S synthesis regulatory protein ExsA